MRLSVRLAMVAIALVACAAPMVVPASAVAQLTPTTDDRLAGLKWTFVRIKYSSPATEEARFRRDYWGDPWAIDGPAAEQNLSRRVKTVTSLEVGDPIVLTLDDPTLWEHPWIYMVEPGNLLLSDDEAKTLREFLLRGGTLTFDDFHGPYEWEQFATEIRKVFPDRPIVDLQPPHPIFTCFYKLDGYPQVAGLGSFLMGRTWEKGGFVAHLRTILDDTGRPMILINWNTDMADGWEWSNAEEYPGYVKHTAEAYRMQINEIIYALTH